MTSTQKAPAAGREAVDLEKIRPGMSADEMQRVREEIVRVASQTLRGL
jgi:hemin uptake protein HemP